MKVHAEGVKTHYTSCNFCDRGEMTKNNYGLSYPYKKVVVFSKETGGLRAAICESCFSELIEKGSIEFRVDINQ